VLEPEDDILLCGLFVRVQIAYLSPEARAMALVMEGKCYGEGVSLGMPTLRLLPSVVVNRIAEYNSGETENL